MIRTVALLAGLAVCGGVPAAETFGKFFYTPAERAQLDLARAQSQRSPQVKAAEPVEAPPTSQVLSYSGMVRRSDGKSVLWLNNRPVDENEAMSSLAAVSGRVRSDGAVTVQVPQTGRSVDLKVGQSVELNSGTVAEGPRIAQTAPGKPPANGKPPADGERSGAQTPEREVPPGRKEQPDTAKRAEEQPRLPR